MRWFPAWLGVVLGMGVLLSLSLFLVIRGWEERDLENRTADLAREEVEKLRVTMLRSMEVLHSIAALHQAHGGIGREEFRQFVRQPLARQPELQALSWNPFVPGTRRAELEAAAQAEGMTNFAFREQQEPGHLIAEGARASYVPVYFIEPRERNTTALGFDLNSDPSRRASIERARDSGLPVATTPVRLAQESGDAPGLLVLLPVYRDGPPGNLEGRRERLEGFAVAVFRVADLVGESFRELQRRGVEARLFDESPAGELIFGPGSLPAVHPAAVTWLEAAGRRWAVQFAPTPTFVAAQNRWQSRLALAGGLAFTLLTIAYLFGGWRRTREVAAANRQLKAEVTVRQQAEAAAESANQAKSDFLASMSHELRTPLNAMLGYCQLMRHDRHLAPEHRDAVAGIQASGHHLLGLINEVLDLAKIEARRMELQPVDFDLAALARGLAATFKPLCAQKRIGFRIEFDPGEMTRVRGDEGKLRQVLINLLGNAVKFTRAGEACLRFQPEPEGRWRFEVIDTGLGIPAGEQADIFKPFHQGSGAQHQGGTGLGLAIAQRQVELLGGTLALQSERGIGSRFHFSVPLTAAQARGVDPGCASDGIDPSRELEIAEGFLQAPVLLPEALCARLTVAAELHSTTALKAALQELRELGPEAGALADHLRHRMRSFDMDGVQQVLADCVLARSSAAEVPTSHETCTSSGPLR